MGLLDAQVLHTLILVLGVCLAPFPGAYGQSSSTFKKPAPKWNFETDPSSLNSTLLIGNKTIVLGSFNINGGNASSLFTLINFNYVIDSFTLLFFRDSPPANCTPFGTSNILPIQTAFAAAGWDVQCLFDNKVTTPLHYLVSHAAICQYPISSVAPSLVGKPVTLKFNGVTFPSVAKLRPMHPPISDSGPFKYKYCGCLTMYYRTADLEEWLHYHFNIGMEKVRIYDNNSEVDHLEETARLLSHFYNLDIIHWPWDHSQQAVIRDCLLELQTECQWIVASDVDEYLVFGKSNYTHLDHVFEQPQFKASPGFKVTMYEYFPSGHSERPAGGAIKSFLCRDANENVPLKSVIKPYRLHPSTFNNLHTFCMDGEGTQQMPKEHLYFNHYKHPSWMIYQRKHSRRANLNTFEINVDNKNLLANSRAMFEIYLASSCVVVDQRLTQFYEENFSYRLGPLDAKPNLRATDLLVTGTQSMGLSELDGILGHSHVDWTCALRRFNTSICREPADLRFLRIVHYVEHPLRALPFIIKNFSAADWAAVYKVLPSNVSYVHHPLKAALYYWIMWNAAIERVSDLQLVQGDLGARVVKTQLCAQHAEFEGCVEKLSSFSKQRAGCLQVMSWKELAGVDAFGAQLAYNMTIGYGLEPETGC